MTLFEYAARYSDPDTSQEAAAHAKRVTGQEVALEALRQAGLYGLTDFELAERTGWQQTSIGKRRHELVKLGLVERSPWRRPSPSGSPSIVWRVKGE